MSKSKAIIEFNLPEDQTEYQMCLKSEQMCFALFGIRNLINQIDKKHRKLDKCFLQELHEYIVESGVYFL